MKSAWIDIRTAPIEHREAIIDAALHARVGAIVADDQDVLATLPATVKRVLAVDGPHPSHLDGLTVLRPVTDSDQLGHLRNESPNGDGLTAALVDVVDDRSLALACESATTLSSTVVQFRDPTKIPLEIVIAAADRSPGELICRAASLQEAEVIIDVLEKGSEGVLMAPQNATDVFALTELLRANPPDLSLVTLTVEAVKHVGFGDRVCVDTCTHFEDDEGMLVGSYAHGFILCCSETHPLPYMPTRPFRVNAGALHSYVLGKDNRTNYLSELKSGHSALAVNSDGRTRWIVVGRIKLESRPLLGIDARSADGTEVNLVVQDDWHVRVLGPGGTVWNVTELKPGDTLLGYVATDKRHVGWPVGEFCVEK